MLKPLLILAVTGALVPGLIGILDMGFIIPAGSREEIEKECVQGQ